MSDFKVSIPKPCNEKWDSMTPKNNNRFCDSCSTTVIDFSKMELEEIKNYLYTHREKKVCGHFHVSHTSIPLPRFHQFLINAYSFTERKFPVRIFQRLTLSVLGATMTLVGCNSSKTTGEALPSTSKSCESKTDMVGKIKVEHQHDSTQTKEGYILGLPAYVPPTMTDTIRKEK